MISVFPTLKAARPLGAVLISLCAVLMPAPAGAAAAASPAAQARTFHRTLTYILKVDGKPGSGRFYLSDSGNTYLIVSPQLPAPVLVDLPTKEVATLAQAPAESNGAISLPAAAARKAQGRYEVKDGSPVFTVEGRQVRMEDPPPLLGLQQDAAVRAYNPEYGRKAAAYQPDPKAIAQLKAGKQPVRLRIYFGTWCPHCSSFLPGMMKVLDALQGAPVTVEYYGLPEDRNGDPEPARMKLQGIPTAIVYRQGKEVGRMAGEQWQRPERALAAILSH